MKVAYVGIDLLYPALTSLYKAGCEIVKIFTCKTDNYTEFNTKVIGFAREHDIPLEINKITKDDLYELMDMGCDFMLCAGYYHIIPVIPEFRIVNVHPSYLPVGRGAWPMPLTILKGLTKSGVTFHQMEKGLDTGKILIQKECPVYPESDDLVSLSERQWDLIPDMIDTLVSDFDRLWENAYPQEGEVQYWDMPDPLQYTIRSDMSFAEADLILRAFKSYECFYIDAETNEKLELIDAVATRTTDGASKPEKLLKLKDGYVICERIRKIQ